MKRHLILFALTMCLCASKVNANVNYVLLEIVNNSSNLATLEQKSINVGSVDSEGGYSISGHDATTWILSGGIFRGAEGQLNYKWTNDEGIQQYCQIKYDQTFSLSPVKNNTSVIGNCTVTNNDPQELLLDNTFVISHVVLD